ncbi:MAG: exonuclease SbcCD subunit D [Chloroflexi bacterium]|nr:exonuclease SbcCD subunit D [Chloroflexota bacterium]
MRIVHFSDLHIGVDAYGRPVVERDLAALPEWFAPGEPREAYLGHSTRLVDFLCAFDELIAYATADQVDLVLFSGDAYKSREPSPTHQREFAKRVARLAAKGVPVFLLAGNHDLPHAAYKAAAIEIFQTLSVPSVTVAEVLRVYRVTMRSGPLQVLALPWVRRSAFLARDEVRNLPYPKQRDLMEQKIGELLQAQAETLDPSLPAVLSAHVSLDTAKLGTERSMMIGDDHIVHQSALTSLPVEYIALGHVHRRQELAQRPWTVYPGSLQRVDFGEEDHEAKGFYVVDLDPAARQGERVRSVTFHPVAARAFVTVDVKVAEGDSDPTGLAIREIERAPVKDAIVRVRVKLPASAEPALHDREIRQALDAHGAHSIASVTKDVERPNRVRLAGAGTETRQPSELLQAYFETRGTPPDRAAKLTSYAQRLMEEEAAEE